MGMATIVSAVGGNMTSKEELKAINGILNIALAPTIRIERDAKSPYGVEYPMTTAERVQWLADELKKKNNELDAIAEEQAGEDL